MKVLLVAAVLFLVTLAHGVGYTYAQTQDDTAKPSTSNEDDDSDMYLESSEPVAGKANLDEAPLQESEQSFYPSFSPFSNPPLGHSRPFFYQQERAYSQKSNPGFNSQFGFDSPPRFSGYKGENSFKAKSSVTAPSDNLLGSGNFGVIKGGTFYAEKAADSAKYENNYNPYYQNGHGRPSFYFGGGNPKPKNNEQFSDFRDFADINAPSNPAFSNYVVVYANRNKTEEENLKKLKNKPKNIIESLALLDLESSTPTEDNVPEKKLSLGKRKLASLPQEKKTNNKVTKDDKQTSSQDSAEPLIAMF